MGTVTRSSSAISEEMFHRREAYSCAALRRKARERTERAEGSVEDKDFDPPASDAHGFRMRIVAQVDTVALDGAAGVARHGIAVALDIETGAQRDKARVHRDHSIAGS